MNIWLSDGQRTISYTIDNNTSLIGLSEFIEVFFLLRKITNREIILSALKLLFSIITAYL